MAGLTFHRQARGQPRKSLRKPQKVPGTGALPAYIVAVCAFTKNPLEADAAHLPPLLAPRCPQQPCLGPAPPGRWRQEPGGDR